MSCPICGRETARAFRPFCSRRCADVDLGRWMTGAYALPSEDPDDAEEAARRPDGGGRDEGLEEG
jgi:endogenous inhibitor of DNA gyrase (YacG/DUF329 family)